MFIKALVVYILLLPQLLFANTAEQTAIKLGAIQDASMKYYEEFEFWPQNIDDLLLNGYLPNNFTPETDWGTSFIFTITGNDLVISVDIPDASILVDLQASINQVDIASRAVKNITASEKRFAEGDRSLAQSSSIQEGSDASAQIFDKGDLDQNSIFRDLTLTDDEIFLKAAKAGQPLTRQPNNFVRISATLKDGVVFKTDAREISFDSNIFVDGAVTAEQFVDANDANYIVDPNQLSILNELQASTLVNAKDDNYIIDFDGASILNDVQLKTLAVGNLLAEKINNEIPITLENLSQYAITKLKNGTNIQVTGGAGQDANVGLLTIATVDDPTFVSMVVNNDIKVGGNLTIGNASPTPLNSNFALNGNDMAVEGDLSLDGNFYLQNKLIINKIDGSELVLDGNSITNSKEIFLQPNGDTTNNLKLSSNGTSATLETTGNNALKFSASDFNFTSNTNSTQAFRFNNSSGNAIFLVDTQNNKVGVNTNTIDSRADLDVEGTLHANTVIIEPLSGDIPLKINTSSEGELIRFDDSSNQFGLYSYSGNPENNVTANKGSLLINGDQGDLYIFRGNNASNVGWIQIPDASTNYVRGGNNFGVDASLGSNDAFSLILETNNIPAITIDPNQTSTFHGNANFSNNDVYNINNLSVSNIQPNATTLDITLNNNDSNALRIVDTDNNPFIVINTTQKRITQGTTTFATNLLTADNVDINGGNIDGITAGSNVPFISLAVSSLTFTGNTIDSISTDNTISFTDNNLITSGTVTTGDIDVTNNNITNVTNIDLASLTANTDTLTINLTTNQSEALRLVDGINTEFLVIDTSAAGSLITQSTTTFAGVLTAGNVDINGGTIDNTIIGANTPAAANFTTLTATTLAGDLDVNNQILSNVIINTGTINVQVLTSTIATLGDISIAGNTITTTASTLDIIPSTTISGTLTATAIDNNNGTLNNVGTLFTDNINPNATTIDINLGNDTSALDIKEGSVSFITIDTTRDIITQGTTTFATNLLTADNVDINGGTLEVSALTSTVATLGNISIVGNTITTTVGDTIDFGSTNLTTAGTITAGTLILPDGSSFQVGNLDADSITALSDTLTISLNDNQPTALRITDGTTDFITIDSTNPSNTITQSTTTFTGLLTANNVDINGGTLEVSALTSTIATLGDISIAGNTITTTASTLDIIPSTTISGTLTATAIDNNNGTLNNVGTLFTDNINPNATTIDINLGNDTSALDIKEGSVSFITIDTTGDIITQGTTTFATNLLTADNVDINGGTLEVSALTSTVATLGNISIVGNTITTTVGDTIDFGSTNLTTAGTITADSVVVNRVIFEDLNELAVGNLRANSTTFTMNIVDNVNSAFLITDGTTDFITIDSTNPSNTITQSTTTFTGLLTANNVDINGGTLEVSALTSTIATLGDISIAGNTITTTASTLDIIPSTTISGTLTATAIDNNNGTLNNVGTLFTDNINPNATTIDINLGNDTSALDIKEGSVSFITIDTTGDTIIQGTTTFTGLLTANNVDINGGTLEVSTFTSTVATLGNISIVGNTITTTVGDTIDFGSTNLTTAGTITADSVVVNRVIFEDLNELAVGNLRANSTTFTMNIVDNVNSAFLITDGTTDFITIDSTNPSNTITQSTTTFTGLLTANNVDINGGTLDDVAIGATTPASIVRVGNITIQGNSITSTADIDFGSGNVMTTGNISVSGIDVNGIDFTTINGLNANTIAPNTGDSLAFNLTDGINPALTITDGTTDFITINTSNDTITQGATTFTGLLTANNVDITGGTLDNVAITATELSVDDITIDGSNITSTSDISFGSTNLITTGIITANALDLSGGTISNVDTVITNTINPNINDTLTVALNNNQNNALTITDGTTDFITINTSNDTITQGATTFTGLLTANNVDITGGTLDNVAITATELSVDDITIDGNQITSNNGTLAFGNNDLSTAGTVTVGNLDINNSNLSNVNDINVNTITPNTGDSLAFNLTDGINPALTITDGTTDFITINTSNDTITQGATTFTGLLTANNVDITGGTLDNVAITATELSVDDITIDGSNITSTSDISFGSTNLITTGIITANALDLSGGTISNVDTVITNTINPNINDTLTVALNNNQNNALTITDGTTDFITINTSNDTITQGATTFTGLLTANNVDITGGTLDNVAITATELSVDDITISGNQITSNNGTLAFGNNDLSTAGTVTVGNLDINNSNLSNVNDINVNTITPNTGDSLAFNLTDGINPALTITDGTTDFITINTSNDTITQGATTFTGLLTANNVDITGGTLDNVAITATELSVDDITIDGSNITSTSDISFGSTNLITTGIITANALDLSGGTISNVDTVITNTINPNINDTLTVALNNNQNNALTITDGTTDFITINTSNDTITQGATTFTGNVTANNNLTVNGLLTANNVDINGGTLDNVAITATELSVDDITIDGSNITSTSDISFGSTNLITTGIITANALDLSGGTISNVDTVITNTINPNINDTLTVALNNNQNNALTITDGTTDFITINTSNDTITQGATTFTGNVTANNNLTVNGLLTANNVDITGGTLDNVAITATELSVDDITIDGSNITSTSDISFGNNNLSTTGIITANALSTTALNSTTNLALSLGVGAGNDFSVAGNALVVEGDTSRVGVGTANPDTNTLLHVQGNEASNYIATIENQNASTSAKGLRIKMGAASEGNTSTGAARFIEFTNGSDTIVGAIEYNQGTFQTINVSDRKTKTNINDTVIDATSILSNLRIVDYHRKTNPNGTKITGFIAQEVQPIFSNMVTRVNSDLLGINETALIPVLVKGFQEQEALLTNLTTSVEVHEDNINLTKALKVNNTTVVDMNNNLFGNTLTLESTIQTTKDRFSIERFNNNQLNTLMTLNTDKIANKDAKGYLSVGDVYLSGIDKWASDGISKLLVFEDTPTISECLTSSQSGKMGIIKHTEELFICLGEKGWVSVSTETLESKL